MKDIFKKITTSVILLSILAIIVGIAMIVYPGMSLVAIGIVISALLIVYGLVLVVLDVKAWRMYIPFEGMLRGILSIILGVLLAMHPEAISVYIGVFVGVWIIMSGISGIKLASALRRTNAPWVIMIIINIIDIIIGGLVIYSPVLSSVSLTMGLGIVIIVHAVINIIDMITVKKNIKEVEKLIVEKFDI